MNTQRMLIVSGLLLGLLCGFTAPWSAHAAGQSNSQYIIDRDVINAGGGRSQSSEYINIGSLGQASPLGSSSNTLHVVYAGFWHGKSFTLSVAKSGTGSGTVKDCLTVSDCPGTRINCGSDCFDFYAEGNSVLLQPFPDASSTFVQWLVDGSPVTAPLYVTHDLTVTAVFDSTCSPPAAFSYGTPANGATNQALDVDVSWESANDATFYTVSFGTASPPPQAATHATETTYDPGMLNVGTTYYWKIAAVNSCGPTEGPEWSFNTTQPPQITTTPPSMINRTYEYDVDARDPDGDPLTFSLNDVPDGMSIDATTGLIVWTAAPTQIGTYTPSVTASDNKGGVSAPQTIPLTVTADTFTTMTVSFLEGVNLQDGATEQDITVLSLGVGTDMSTVTDIVLPNMPNLFTFSALATFHVEYQGGQAVIAPEPAVAQLAVEDTASGGKSFEEIQTANLNTLAWTTPSAVATTGTQSLVFQRTDGTYVKIGQISMNLTAGTITFAYADVTP